MIVRLPFPPKELMPNRAKGVHWAALSKVREKYRNDAYLLAKSTPSSDYGDGNIPVSIVFSTPDKRGRDLDNMLASIKHGLDGIAAALGLDDRRFKPLLVDSVLGEKPGCVIVAVGVHVTTTIGEL